MHAPRLTALASVLVAAASTGRARAETIRIAIGTQDTTINTVHAGLLVRELGLLEARLPCTGKYAGVRYDVVWKNFTSGPPLTGEMIAGKLDIGALGDFPSVLNGVAFQKQGGRSVYLATLSGSAIGAGNGLMVPADSPVQSLRELAGKRISVPFGSAAHGMLLRAIRDLGWDPERDVTLVSQSPEVGGTSLRSHKIDAHADFVPFPELFPFRGHARKIFDGSTVKVPTSHGLVARGDFADRYPELVVAFLRAVLEADRLLAADPETQAELVQKVAGVDAEVVYMFHGPLGIQTRDYSIKPATRQSLQMALDTLTLLGRADNKLDFDRWVDDRFIRQAARESGLDYQARLHSEAPVPLDGTDARTDEPILDPHRAAQIWVRGEKKVRAYASVASALLALAEVETQGRAARAIFTHDRQSGLKLLGDKAWYVAAGLSTRLELSAFLNREGAREWVRAHGGAVLDFAGARRAVSAPDGPVVRPARASL
jgi:NitT/TauT family transport system substrate-binding protein